MPRPSSKVRGMSANRPALLNVVVPDQWADVLGEQPALITAVPEGWDTVKSFADNHNKSTVRGAHILVSLVGMGKAERKLVRFAEERHAFYIYRRKK